MEYKAKFTVKVSRKSSTQEWVVTTRNEGKLVGTYYTDDKKDANDSATLTASALEGKGITVEVKLAK